MNTNNLKRLIWKEWREGWPVLAAFFILPAIVFPICTRFNTSDFAGAAAMALLFGIPFTSVLWGSEKRRMVRGGRDVPGALLPVSPMEDWVASFLLPSIAVTVCGGWLYYLHSFTGIYFTKGDWHEGILVCALAFMLCSFLSKSVSHFLGITVGTLVIIWHMLGPTQYSGYVQSDIYMKWHRAYLWLPSVVAGAALVASEMRKAGPKRLKVFGMAIVPIYVVVMIMPPLKDVGPFCRNLGFYARAWRNQSPCVWDGDYSVQMFPAPEGGSRVDFEDRRVDDRADRSRFVKERRFVGYPKLLGNCRDTVYMLDKPSGDKTASVIRWNAKSGKIDRIRLESKDGFAEGIREWYRLVLYGYDGRSLGKQGNVDDTGTRLLLVSYSSLGTGYDIGLIDLKTRRCGLLVSNVSFSPDEKVTWMKDRAFVTGSGPSLQIDTREFTARPLVWERRCN